MCDCGGIKVPPLYHHSGGGGQGQLRGNAPAGLGYEDVAGYSRQKDTEGYCSGKGQGCPGRGKIGKICKISGEKFFFHYKFRI